MRNYANRMNNYGRLRLHPRNMNYYRYSNHRNMNYRYRNQRNMNNFKYSNYGNMNDFRYRFNNQPHINNLYTIDRRHHGQRENPYKIIRNNRTQTSDVSDVKNVLVINELQTRIGKLETKINKIIDQLAEYNKHKEPRKPIEIASCDRNDIYQKPIEVTHKMYAELSSSLNVGQKGEMNEQDLSILHPSKDNENIIFKYNDEDLPFIQNTSQTKVSITDNPVIKDSSTPQLEANSNGLITVANVFSSPDLKTDKEQVLNKSQNDCYYNLRKDIKKDESDDNEIIENLKVQEELQKLAKEFQDIPVFMLNVVRTLFENVKADKVFIKFYPKQLHLNKFINDILECCNGFGKSIISHRELQSQQQIAPKFKHLYKYLCSDALPASKDLVRQIITLSEEMCLLDGILCHFRTDKLTSKLEIRPVIPTSQLALRLIHNLHSSKSANHLAITSTYNILNSKYYIKNLFNLIKMYVKGRDSCNFA